jgi:ABC-2 type transport system permease protein
VSALLAGLQTGFRRGLATPGDLVVRLGFYALILVVQHALWSAATDAAGGTLAGYTAQQLGWYFLGAQAAVLGPRQRTIEEVGTEIGSGAIAVAMLRPVSVVGMRFCLELGEAAVRVLAACALGVVETWLLVGPPAHALVLLALPASAVLAAALSIAGQHAFGGIAFWVLDAKAAWFLYGKLVFLFGGLLLPLEVLPDRLAAVARALPWAGMAYAPGRISAGYLSWSIIAFQLAWLVALVGAQSAVFAAGERRVQVLGG